MESSHQHQETKSLLLLPPLPKKCMKNKKSLFLTVATTKSRNINSDIFHLLTEVSHTQQALLGMQPQQPKQPEAGAKSSQQECKCLKFQPQQLHLVLLRMWHCSPDPEVRQRWDIFLKLMDAWMWWVDTYGVHQDVSVVLAVIWMLLQLRLPKSQKVPVKRAWSQICLKLAISTKESK